MYQTAEHSVFHACMQVDKTRGKRSHAEVFYLFVGVTQAHHFCIADVGDSTVFNENRTVLDGLG